jgi:hypothetical protein
MLLFLWVILLCNGVVSAQQNTDATALAAGKGRDGWKNEKMEFSVAFYLKLLNSNLVAPEPLYQQIPRERRCGLFIGINEYKQVSKLRYAVNDAEDFRSLFTGDKYRFPSENTRTLTNRDATRESVFSSIRELDKKGAEGLLVLTFSGHGFLRETGQQADPFVEYLVPVDGEPSSPTSLIADTELFEKLAKTSFKHVYVFIDACFGAAPETDQKVSRTISPQSTVQRGAGLFADALRGIRVVGSNSQPQNPVAGAPPRIVVVTAAAANQPALELPDREHGMFSYYLLAALSQGQERVGLADMLGWMRSRLAADGVRQVPILEDTNGRQIYLTGSTLR